MKDYVYYAALYDCYKGLLTDTEKECFDAYYCEDYSMQEIADIKNVSRSAIHKNLKKVLEKLNYYESILHINEKNDMIKNVIQESSNEKLISKLNEILEK